MSDKTQIAWADATWNVAVGCSKVSVGCDNCYAIRTAHRMASHPNANVRLPYEGVAEDGEWTGTVNVLPDRLDIPRHWKKPRRIFVGAQTDLFHPAIQTSFLIAVFRVMSACPQHTFQVLTKRPARMRSLLLDGTLPVLPNVWLGVTAEDQWHADRRVPILLETPAAVRWVSAEPLLGPLDLWTEEYRTRRNGIDWVVVGGESGPGARPMHPNWVRSLRDQCRDHGVAFFFKQWGEWAPSDVRPANPYTDRECLVDFDGNKFMTADIPWEPLSFDMTHPMRRVGRRAAGDLIDGYRHHAFPDKPVPRYRWRWAP